MNETKPTIEAVVRKNGTVLIIDHRLHEQFTVDENPRKRETLRCDCIWFGDKGECAHLSVAANALEAIKVNDMTPKTKRLWWNTYGDTNRRAIRKVQRQGKPTLAIIYGGHQ